MPVKRRKRAKARKSPARKRVMRRKSKSKSKSKSMKRKHAGSTGPIRTAFKKSHLVSHIAEHTGLSRKQVSSVFEETAQVMHRHLKSGAAGEFTMPGLLKCVVKHKPATKSRKGINPFTGEMITFKAKPARNVIKVRALKRLKEMVK